MFRYLRSTALPKPISLLMHRLVDPDPTENEMSKTQLASRGIGKAKGSKPRSALEPKVSRDGGRVTFVVTFDAGRDQEPKPRAYTGPDRNSLSRRIAGVATRDASDLDPALSSDGRALAFTSESAGPAGGVSGLASIYALSLPSR
jgi:hypothetical protein